MGSSGTYAGDVTPETAWQGLAGSAEARLVDVRTQPEWSFVGIPDLANLGKKVILASWQVYPGMAVDGGFVTKVEGQLAGSRGPLYFICRSGARSRAAAIAMTEAGFGPCFNVAGGFEGDRDAAGHRGQSNGWKVAGLPWIQD
ncbi:thiosulfate sulfurtransferase [Dongia mobilis]|uniref:Thiosulfate sulfurtransferase n=1 Tax=Dongia mobilis TaxID=578943 RepID=A0A4R6WVB5_9PROT|nr:rhodanese-like domain-containing protein [Dongia mobilis]TDQ83246.1 thiosulfate sulfurtransferase [Dongia mobilis]